MAGKLDQSLDDIVKSHRQTNRRAGRGGRRAAATGRKQVVAVVPVGGIAKTTKSAKATNKAAATAIPVTGTGESKIIVSGLPADVTDTQIKDYFGKTIGPVKRVYLTYGPNGQSKGIATISFVRSGSAAEAAAQLNGVKVDNRAMKIEVILSAGQAPVAVPVKALGDRIVSAKANPKAQPKPANSSKATTGASAGAGRRARGRGARSTRGKPKTAAELDAEMTDYFDTTANATGTVANATAAVTTGGDTGMQEDEIL